MKKTISTKIGAFLAVLLLTLSMFSITAFAADAVKLNYGTNGKQINVIASIPYEDSADYTDITFTSSKDILYVSSSEGKKEVNGTSVTLSLKSGTSTVTFALDGVSNCTCNIKVTYMDNSGSNIKTLSNSISPVFTGNTPNELQNGSSSAGSPNNPNRVIAGSPNIVTHKETTTASAPKKNNTASSKNETTTSSQPAANETTTSVETKAEETTAPESTTKAPAVPSTTAPAENPTAANDQSKEQNKDEKSLNLGLIIMFVIIALALIGLVIALVIYYKDRKKSGKDVNEQKQPKDVTLEGYTANEVPRPVTDNSSSVSDDTADIQIPISTPNPSQSAEPSVQPPVQ